MAAPRCLFSAGSSPRPLSRCRVKVVCVMVLANINNDGYHCHSIVGMYLTYVPRAVARHSALGRIEFNYFNCRLGVYLSICYYY